MTNIQNSNFGEPYSSSSSGGEINTITLDGDVNNGYPPYGSGFTSPDFSLPYTSVNGKTVYIVGGTHSSSSSGEYSDWNSCALLLRKYTFSDDPDTSRQLAGANRSADNNICRISGCAVARTAGEEYVYPIFFNGSGVQNIAKIGFNDFGFVSSFPLQRYSSVWNVIPIKDPDNAGDCTCLLVISSSGDVS